ncbi:hypothetical protein C8Q80DRAFT_1194175 [Daedaleopsis nitida]|nr:hypothetical protein C8Q80DRAFT_1194175 [Daedaleopsis nitida]
MTSRLKRKLNDLGVDTASSKANETFCLIGTPLPPLEKSKDTGEFVPLWKQEVRDEKGRRRLHGAFTGGFSAGYFNSVGSKEGWTPSTFVSSRSDRAKKRAAQPEDFMDDEDLAELREDRKLVDEHEEMNFGGTAAEKRRQAGEADEQDPISAALAASFAPVPNDSVGARILKKMGWKIGQGIGPRLTYAQRKAQDAGFFDPSKEAEGDEGDVEEAKKHTYPRRDMPVLSAPRKDNFHGLGYSTGMGLNESVGYGVGGERAPSGPKISAGFGLGALNDADDDDIDIYDGAAGPSARSRVAFDAAIGDDDYSMRIGTSSSKRTGTGPRAPPGITQTFKDGTPVLKGFVLSDNPVSEDRWFPMPDIPARWQPNPRRVWEQEHNKENEPSADQARPAPSPSMSHSEWKANKLSADQRGNMLGETPPVAKTRSVFEYLSLKDRERLQAFRTARVDGVPPPSTASPDAPRPSSPGPPPLKPGGVNIPRLYPSIAKAALSGFQPFTADPLKQSRYTAFLTFQASASPDSSESLGFGPLPGQSTDEFNKELEDYAKSATVFKPLSGAMAGRFRSAVVVEMGPKVVEGLHQPTSYGENPDGENGEQKEEEDPKMGSVRMGMYGPLTRETVPWQPARLLCKRFGVKEPEVDLTAHAGEASAGFEFATTEAKREFGSVPAMITDGTEDTGSTAVKGEDEQKQKNSGPRSLANVGLGEDETQGRDILTYERPAMDVFKAIFASDDEDSDDDDDDEGDGNQTGLATSVVPLPSRPPATSQLEAKAPATIASSSTEKVDLATFKPTFVPRSERESRNDKTEKSKNKKKEKDKKKTKTTLMSFDVEDDGSIPSFGPAPSHRSSEKKRDRDKDKDGERRKTKKRKEAAQGDDNDDDGMWVEKPAPEVVKTLQVAPVPTEPSGTEHEHETIGREAGPPRGRKRAIDFM